MTETKNKLKLNNITIHNEAVTKTVNTEKKKYF